MPKAKSVFHGTLRGIGVSEGIAIAKAWAFQSPWDEVVVLDLPKSKIADEVKRYRNALDEVARQLDECRVRVRKDIGLDEAKIFDAHLSILNDPFFQKKIPDQLQRQRINTEAILKHGVDRLKRKFQKMENEYFKHRADDIQDVAVRLLRVLLRTEEVPFSFKQPMVIVAHNLTPSDTARIDRKRVLGFATELGGETSHVSILARSMGLPAVVGVERLMREAVSGDTVVVDGLSGIVYINPPPRILKEYQKREVEFKSYLNRLAEEAVLPSETLDRVPVGLYANISMSADMSLAQKYRCDGIGLFRTELPFLAEEKLLTEEEQFHIYRHVVEGMEGKPVTIRTLDLGGDKFLPFQGVQEESNPFLGWRSIRIFLQERDVFKVQLRAILRASAHGHVRILFPMISSLEEIFEIRDLLQECKDELSREEIPFNPSVPSGIMIEIPSAAVLAERLIQYTDFFSIGTNDLIQYTLAVDRNNDRVAKFYQPLNPAILKLIRGTVDAAREARKPVSLCGEMAGNPVYIPLLLGLGLQSFSVSPVMLPEVKERIRAVSSEECRDLAEEILAMDSTEDINRRVFEFHHAVNKRQNVPFFTPTEITKKT